MLQASIFFHPDAYIAGSSKLMGRHAAGSSFLRGVFRHAKAEVLSVYVTDSKHADTFQELARSSGETRPIRFLSRGDIAGLSNSTLYYPGPDIGGQAFNRSLIDGASWSLSGITHTTSSAKVMDSLCDLLTAPVYPWDAVICTSKAVKQNVETLLQGQVDYLKDRLGITKLVLPKFPVIPLGVHCSDFAFSDEQRSDAREKLGLVPEDVVVLFLGRLSFHAKAHPLAMYKALEAASVGLSGPGRVVLIECGWFANDWIKESFEEASALACPSVRVIRMDGRTPKKRDTALACADIFCSLSDNIQETFGISPIEAMAAGLPVIVSDWDGYRESVRDGIDGFRIPTLMPGTGLGGDLAYRHALGIDTYDVYCGYSSSFVAVDVEATEKAFSQLISSPELRKKMGDAGRARAMEVYDWKHIIAQYETLWEELGKIRAAAAMNKDLNPSHGWPVRSDPFKLFQNYPTAFINDETYIRLVSGSNHKAREEWMKYSSLKMISFPKPVLASEDEILRLFDNLNADVKQIKALIELYPEPRIAIVFRTIHWLLKVGFIKADKIQAKSLLKH